MAKDRNPSIRAAIADAIRNDPAVLALVIIMLTVVTMVTIGVCSGV